MSSCYHVIMSSFYQVIMSLYHHVIMWTFVSMYHHVIMSSCYHLIIWACHLLSKLSYEHAIMWTINMWTYQHVNLSTGHHVITSSSNIIVSFFTFWVFIGSLFVFSGSSFCLDVPLSSCFPLSSLLSSSLCYHLSSLSSPLGDEHPLVSQVKFLVQHLESRVHIFYRVFQKMSHSNL